MGTPVSSLDSQSCSKVLNPPNDQKRKHPIPHNNSHQRRLKMICWIYLDHSHQIMRTKKMQSIQIQMMPIHLEILFLILVHLKINQIQIQIAIPTQIKVSKLRHQKKKKKKKKKKGRTRAQTAAAVTTKSTSPSDTSKDSPNKNESENKSTVKMKKIDILPLLHTGIRANKFKLNGNKSKVRTFFLTESNFYFCWEAVGAQKEKKSLFGGKTTSNSNRDKVDKDRSIPIRSIRSLQKNPAYMMQSYGFIPPQQKAMTLTIVYSANGQKKKLNFMAYEAFHHLLFYEGLQDLIGAARDSKRNLSEIFELYVDFPKEILPKHLRPQRFKWEPLGDNDFAAKDSGDDKKKDDDDDHKHNNMYFDSNPASLKNVNVYDPTLAQYGRNRVKSF